MFNLWLCLSLYFTSAFASAALYKSEELNILRFTIGGTLKERWEFVRKPFCVLYCFESLRSLRETIKVLQLTIAMTTFNVSACIASASADACCFERGIGFQ